MCTFLCGHTFSTHLDKYLGAQLWNLMLIACLTFWETTKLSFKVTVPFRIPSINEWKLLFLHILVSIWYCQFFGLQPFWKVCGGIHCCSNLRLPMTYDEHLFICLFSICISSLIRCLFRCFAHFLIGLYYYYYYYYYYWVLRVICTC